MKEDRSIGRLISILYRHAKVYFQYKLGPYNLGHGQMPVLMYIINHKKVTQFEINNHFQLDKGSTSTLIKNLEKNGFIRKEQDQNDKRSYWIFITEKTKRLIPVFKEIFKGWTDVLTEDFEELEKEQAFSLLSRMISNSKNYLEDRKDLHENKTT